ncbi:hypothetical protein K505DRAFT_156635 [Melanomma pulvis-pyrius CBS 109.77]|uniref:Uncharacterized protein n=1 Tax=Melanomma pulvis-pyrius CBS 109.77 TaxID=1314802 RepID=A0A6A6XKV3_9PLEO|nr:hypothetical protein K505DRAFT_156635 [Melanomma pulvis-pyrius CBS 109.77]
MCVPDGPGSNRRRPAGTAWAQCAAACRRSWPLPCSPPCPAGRRQPWQKARGRGHSARCTTTTRAGRALRLGAATEGGVQRACGRETSTPANLLREIPLWA